ncbi:MAG: hypothetical protein WA876_16130 [Candidatus Acidiferrales bacterium]
MNVVLRFSKWLLLLAACCFILCGSPAFATPVTYDYSSSGISGSVTVSAALGDNFLGFISPTAFSFMDGSLTITSSEILTVSSFFAVTNASGEIVDWNILLKLANGNVLETSCCVNDLAITVSNNGDISSQLSGSPGVWSVASTPMEEPSSLMLLGTGLLGLVPLIRRSLATP